MSHSTKHNKINNTHLPIRTNTNTVSKKNVLQGKQTKKGVGVRVFEIDITIMFLEILMMVKLYHWKTRSYAQHKATDDFYSSLNNHMDTFIEVLMGKTNKRIDLTKHKTVKLIDITQSVTNNTFIEKLESFKVYLVGLEQTAFIKSMPCSDLLNIRDEILSDINKLLYLLSLD